jgi:bifunctional DNA-binding transcriptional regulator/antitoxin component of YhaV-PrlF toxin-antitoxin module
MARRTLEDRNVRKVTKTGGGKSYSVTIPIEIMRKLGWRERQKVVVKQQGKKIVIEDFK